MPKFEIPAETVEEQTVTFPALNPMAFVTSIVTSPVTALPTTTPMIPERQDLQVLTTERQEEEEEAEEVEENEENSYSVLTPQPIPKIPSVSTTEMEKEYPEFQSSQIVPEPTVIPPTFSPQNLLGSFEKKSIESTPRIFKPIPSPAEDISFEDGEEGDNVNFETESVVTTENEDLSVEPTAIRLSKEKNDQMRVEWEAPIAALCDNYVLNYTVLDLSTPKSFTVPSQNNSVLIKMLVGHKLDLKVNCIYEGVISNQWWAQRTVDLGSRFIYSKLLKKTFFRT